MHGAIGCQPKKLVVPGTDEGRRNRQTPLFLTGLPTHLFSPCISLTLWTYALVVWSNCTQIHCLCSHTDLEPQYEMQKASRGVRVKHCTATSMSTCAALKAAQWMSQQQK